MAFDIYKTITDKVIEQLEKGVAPWTKPWFGVAGGGAVSHATGKSYSPLNQCLIGEQGEYLTFNQIKQAGGKLHKGAKSSLVTFYKLIPKNTEDSDDNQFFPIMRYYRVFNILDTDVTPKHEPKLPKRNHVEACAEAEALIEAYARREDLFVTHWAGNKAYYAVSNDRVTLPDKAQFTTATGYYSAVFHELVHSTGADKRLGRGFSDDKKEYAREELVAEMGAAAIMHRLGIQTDENETNNTAYLGFWMGVLEKDSHILSYAAKQAADAVAFIFGDTEKFE